MALESVVLDRVLIGDCRSVMPPLGPFDMILADPPYKETSLSWDKKVEGWLRLARAALKPTGSLWCFGSLRSFMSIAGELDKSGLRLSQDIIWEKHNGSGFRKDRFKRVHEQAIQLYRTDSSWEGVYNDVQVTHDARARTVRRKKRPPHMGKIEQGHYTSEDGGPRLMRSVIKVRSCHGFAIHETEKPVALLEILIRTSCPPLGLVGDWFAGSGAGGEACIISNRRYIGCENVETMARKANDRLSALLPFGGSPTA